MAGEYKRVSRREMMAAAQDSASEDKFKDKLIIGDDINRQDIVKIGDAVFFDRVMFNFENNRFVNAIFLNEVKDREYSDFASSHNIEFNQIESSISLQDNTERGIYLSTKICTTEGVPALLNDFFLIVDEEVPPGTDILYYLVTNYGEVYPIRPNSDLPLRIEGDGPKPLSFKIKAVLTPNGNDKPKIRGLAMLYFDEFVERQLGLVNPDLGPIESIPIGDEDVVTLIRDNTKEDKLVQVISSLEHVSLKYSDDGEELQIIEVNDAVSGAKKEESLLIYGDYENSDGDVERVLHQIRTKREQKSKG